MPFIPAAPVPKLPKPASEGGNPNQQGGVPAPVPGAMPGSSGGGAPPPAGSGIPPPAGGMVGSMGGGAPPPPAPGPVNRNLAGSLGGGNKNLYAGAHQDKLKAGAAAAAKVPPPAAAPEVPEWQKMYQDMMSANDASSAMERGEIQHNSQLAMHAGQRQADVLNARLGRSIAGGYAGLQGQAMIGGMESQRKALAEQALRSGDKKNELQMGYLDRILAEKKTKDAQAFETGLQERGFAHDLDMQGNQLAADTLPGSNAFGPIKAKAYDGAVGELKASGKLTPEASAKMDELYQAAMKGAPGAAAELDAFLKANGSAFDWNTVNSQRMADDKADMAGSIEQFLAGQGRAPSTSKSNKAQRVGEKLAGVTLR